METNEYMAKYMKQRYGNRRRILIDLLGGKCVVCETKTQLQFHHVNPATKEFEIAKRLASAPMHVLVEEALKCELRCRAHHEEHHTTWKHGTLAGYKYCKCTECRAAKAAWMKTYRRPEK